MHFTPRVLAELNGRGAEVVAPESFPPAAQDVVVGLRDGLVLSFAQPLTHFRQHLIEGALYAIVGIESDCRIGEYREKEEGTSFVRIIGTNRAEFERVAEAFYRRVWEETGRTAPGSWRRTKPAARKTLAVPVAQAFTSRLTRPTRRAPRV